MKLKSHYYLARLLLREIEAGQGDLYIRGSTCRMAKDLHTAVMEHKEAFLAGAIGPDIYPDMLVGEQRIHPKKNINPAFWLAMMLEELHNNYDLTSPEGEQAYAFVAGWMTHCACDVLMNTYINHILTEETVGDAKDPPASNDAKKLKRAVESYLDGKISDPSQSGANLMLNLAEIIAPYKFLKRFFFFFFFIFFNISESRSEFIIPKPDDDKKTNASNKSDGKDDKAAKSDKTTSASKDEAAKSDKTTSTSGDEADDIAMLDFSEECLDIFFLMGGLRRAFFYDENAPFDEQNEIGKNDDAKSDRRRYLQMTDKLIDYWLNMYESLAEKLLLLSELYSVYTKESLLSDFKVQLQIGMDKLAALMTKCSEIIYKDGIPQWLLDYLLRKDYLSMGELTGNLGGAAGDLKGDISIKITGPLGAVVKQVSKLVKRLNADILPKMTENIYKSMEAYLKDGNPEAVLKKGNPELLLKSLWAKKGAQEEFDESIVDIGKARSSVGMTFTPFVDALTLMKLCLIGRSGFDKLVEEFYSRSPRMIKLLFDDPKKGKMKMVKPKLYPPSFKRLRFSVREGDPKAIEYCEIMYGNYDLLEVKRQNTHNSLYALFNKYYPYTDLKTVTLKVKTGTAGVAAAKAVTPKEVKPETTPDDKSDIKYVIAVEAEALWEKDKWLDLVRLEGTLKSISGCTVVYTDDLPENVDHSPPKVDHSDGVSSITIPITFKKLSKVESEKINKQYEMDFDVSALAFVRSLETGKEWMRLEKDNPVYYYMLRSLLHLTDKCYA